MSFVSERTVSEGREGVGTGHQSYAGESSTEGRGGGKIRAREMSSPHTQRHPNSIGGYDGVDCGASALAMTGDCRSRALAIAPDDSADCMMI